MDTASAAASAMPSPADRTGVGRLVAVSDCGNIHYLR
jgi:hypothetical protein